MTRALAYYFVTDIESDGGTPLQNSMLSFATVAVREDGEMCGEFEAVLERRPDREADPRTLAFWQSQPEAWAAATANPEPPGVVMRRFADWVVSYDGKRSFAARPVTFDGIWIDHYLREFADSHISGSSTWAGNIFTAGALDLGSYVAGVFNRTDPHPTGTTFPPAWLGDHDHTHRAIDDARGYAFLLARLLRIAGAQPRHPDDFVDGMTG